MACFICGCEIVSPERTLKLIFPQNSTPLFYKFAFFVLPPQDIEYHNCCYPSIMTMKFSSHTVIMVNFQWYISSNLQFPSSYLQCPIVS